MTSENSPEVRKAREALASALGELEDAVNIPKRFDEFRSAKPVTFLAAVGGAGVVVLGIATLAIGSLFRRR